MLVARDRLHARLDQVEEKIVALHRHNFDYLLHNVVAYGFNSKTGYFLVP